jgi:hypothetical protein
MKSVSIDISNHIPTNVDIYLSEFWDFVITVCDNAKEVCPTFNGNVTNLVHKAFDDPSDAVGEEEFVWSEFERIQDKHAFCYLCVPRWLTFLEHTKSHSKAEKTINDLKNWISNNGIISEDKTDEGWGLYGKPHRLNYATSPDSILYSIFTKESLKSDMDALINKQKEDGRWDTWYGISEGTKLEWAGLQTLSVLKTLKNYNRIDK